jgi:formylglycine-generating enzyme required for sulfatase activity
VETVRVLAPLALWMHQTSPGVGLVKQEDMRRVLEKIYASRGIPESAGAAQQLLADAREYAGLLLERGPGEYGFIHLTFQEYLAAVAIALQGQREVKPVIEALAAHVGDDNWREVILLTIGYIGIVQQRDEAAGDVVWELIKRSPGEPGRAVALVGEAVLDAWPGGVTRPCKDKVVQALVRTMVADRHVKPALRAAAGRALAKLGDPRFREDAWYLPDELLLGFVEIPAGTFLMGTQKEDILTLLERFQGSREWYEREIPQHPVELASYYIARYPVTAAQFRVFVQESRYGVQGLWEQYSEGENRPIVTVTWYDTQAYCTWLTEQLRAWKETPEPLARLLREGRWRVRLPTEAEWEKAARGEDGCIFSWGDEPDPNRANYDDTGIGTTSAVGCFPGGHSPYGVLDMSGNAWEWCHSLYKPYPYDPKDGREDPESKDKRVLRGGAFDYDHRSVRCAYRDWSYPSFRLPSLGFRVVVAPGF